MTTVKMVKCPGRCGQLIRADWGHACPPEKQPPTARATMTTGRVYKSIVELGCFDWGTVSEIIDDALSDARRSQEGKRTV